MAKSLGEKLGAGVVLLRPLQKKKSGPELGQGASLLTAVPRALGLKA
jgi:hypothetical protein